MLATLRIALLIAIFGTLAAGGYYIMVYPAPGKPGAWNTSDDIGSDGVRGRIKVFKMSEKTANQDRWNLNADVVDMKDKVKEMSDVNMHYFPAMKRGLELDMSSRNAVVQNDSNDIAFSGEVVIKTSGTMATILHTQTINWSQKKRQIFTSDAIRLDSRKAVITGKGLVVDVDRQTFKVLNAVQAVF